MFSKDGHKDLEAFVSVLDYFIYLLGEGLPASFKSICVGYISNINMYE